MDILEKIGNLLNEKIDMSHPFAVVSKGGGIGDKKGEKIKGDPVVATFATKDEAKEYAKGRRKGLTKGEKGYYKMKYLVVSNPKEK